MVFNNNLLLGAAGQGGGYEIDQSIRFDNVDGVNAGGAQMYRLALTGTPTNDKKATISAWVKRATLGYYQAIAYSGDPNGSTFESLRFNSDDTITFSGATSVYTLTTNQVFKDVSAWYHIVAEIDTSAATAADRASLYVNGEKVTSFSTATYPTLNRVINWTASSGSIAHTWGTNGIPSAGPSSQLFSGYMAEMYVLDGENAGPTAFGEFDNSGVWIPTSYSGAFGNNGYYMTGETASALGDDFSGNGLDFTTVALDTTDQMSDTPTDNYCVLSPIDKFGSGLTLSDGNLKAVPSASAYCNNHGTFYVNSGKWVFEVKHTTVFGEACGWSPMGEEIAGSSNRGYFMFADGRAYINITNQGTKGASLASGDYRYIFYDADLGAMWFAHVDVSSSNALVYDNSATKAEIEAGTTTNAVFTSIQDVDFAPGIWMDTSGVIEVNFGQSDFITTSDLPTGFNTLNTANLDTPSIKDGSKYFNTVLYEGNGGGQRVGQFQPITETYTVPNSVIFNDDNAAYLYRDVGSAPTNGKKFTYSVWIKRGAITTASNCGLLSGGSGASTGRCDLIFTAGADTGDGSNFDSLKFDIYSGGFDQTRSLAKLTDPSTWYHIVLVFDAENATANDTLIMYLNGARLELDSTSGVPNVAALVNANGQRTRVGADASATPVEFDGYMAEIYMIDGQALGPDSFGQLDASTNRWIPKDASGLTFGTNGFYLDMETAPGTGSGAGTDSSGNGNNFTETGLTASDQVTDSPTDNQSVLDANRIDAYTLSQGNLFTNAVGDAAAIGTIAFDPQDEEGFYFEAKVTTAATYPNVGIRSLADIPTGSSMSGDTTGRYSYKGNTGQFSDEGTVVSYGDVWAGTADKVIGVYIKAGELFFSVDGTIQNSGTPAKTGLTGLMVPTVFYDAGSGTHASWEMRFNSSDWSTTPSGYKSISTDNLPLSNGDLSAFVWIKNRDAADNHMLFDAVRGATKDVHSNTVDAEVTNANTLTRFLRNGFEVSNDVQVNTSGESYVAWQWLNDSLTASSNTDGSITSTVLANTTSGFSTVTYVGNSTSGATVGHGLGAVPKMMILKDRDVGENWVIYNDALGPTKFMYFTTDGAFTASNRWNDTAPTSSVFTLGNETQVNATGRDYVVYCFAEIPGYSSFGSYTGNSSTDGPFVYTGFKPAFIMTKRSDSTSDWTIEDTTRSTFNLVENALFPNLNIAEDTTGDRMDILSNGFKLRTTQQPNVGTLIYMAFAEHPFGGVGAAPATAR
jgi:hypothetical protein